MTKPCFSLMKVLKLIGGVDTSQNTELEQRED